MCIRDRKGCAEVFETAKRRAGEYCICRCIREVETVKNRNDCYYINDNILVEECKQICTKERNKIVIM